MTARCIFELFLVMTMLGCGHSLEEHCDPSEMYGLPVANGKQDSHRSATVTMGRLGDHWLDTMQALEVKRSKHGDHYGYSVTYPSPDGGDFTLFWTRGQIDFHGTSPRYRLGAIEFTHGRIWYPDKITSKSLPDVYRAIRLIERDYKEQAEGAMAAAEVFAVISALGGVAPTTRGSMSTRGAQGSSSKALPAGRPGILVTNKLLPHEEAFAREIVAYRGGTFIGTVSKNRPGIDGLLDGVAVSLKETKGGLAAVLRHASKAETSASKAGLVGVELFIRAPNVSRSALLGFARNGPLAQIPSQGVISAITVFTRDGVVRIISGAL